jgi:hypothetical protein
MEGVILCLHGDPSAFFPPSACHAVKNGEVETQQEVPLRRTDKHTHAFTHKGLRNKVVNSWAQGLKFKCSHIRRTYVEGLGEEHRSSSHVLGAQ